MQRLFIPALLAVMLIGAACGGDNGDGGNGAGREITAIAGNSELVVGENRFALGLIDDENRPVLEAAGTSVHLRFLLGDDLQDEQDASFVWAIPDVNGFWTAVVDFDQAGEWSVEATATIDGEEASATLPVLVTEVSVLPNVGDQAPASENLTLESEPNIRRISTDEHPEPAFYQMTVAQALEDGRPFVVVFATPAFCQTRFCGPVVDNVKAVREQFSEQVNFIHIEPFELDDEGRLVVGEENAPVPAQPTVEWRLRTEPWIFIVNADGTIAKRFEGAANPAELAQAIEAVLG